MCGGETTNRLLRMSMDYVTSFNYYYTTDFGDLVALLFVIPARLLASEN